MLASYPLQVLLVKDFVWKITFKICGWMEVEISSNMKFLKLYQGEEEAKAGAT